MIKTSSTETATGLLIGYARVSTDDQDLSNQHAELHVAGGMKIFAEKITGTQRDRPELARLLDHLRTAARQARAQPP